MSLEKIGHLLACVPDLRILWLTEITESTEVNAHQRRFYISYISIFSPLRLMISAAIAPPKRIIQKVTSTRPIAIKISEAFAQFALF
jgi:hypothetical protein